MWCVKDGRYGAGLLMLICMRGWGMSLAIYMCYEVSIVECNFITEWVWLEIESLQVAAILSPRHVSLLSVC